MSETNEAEALWREALRACEIREAELGSGRVAAVAVLRAALAAVDLPWRRLLFLRHGCVGLYGDDGEMQCGACALDFKRMPVADIEDRWKQINMRKLAERLAPEVYCTRCYATEAMHHPDNLVLRREAAMGRPFPQPCHAFTVEQPAPEDTP
jgi:predicted aminopeptidase